MRKSLKIALFPFTCVVIFITALVFLRDKKPILSKIEYSISYSDRNGNLMKVFLTTDEKYRMFKDISSFPPDFIEELLEQEDKRFFIHKGVNPFSVVRAAFSTYILKSRVIGASTITMQTAKLVYKINSHSIFGKILQIILAYRLELNHTKQEILEAYLNLAPCGRNIEGFESASQYFFGKTISETNFEERTMLCVLPQNPIKRCPSKEYFPIELEESMKRLSSSFDCEDKPIIDETTTFSKNLKLICEFPEKALHLSRSLKQTLRTQEATGKTKFSKPKISERTTIDSRLQNILDRRIKNYVNNHSDYGIKNACAILVDSQSMEVLAYTGSANFWNEKILGQVDGNISKRSPGSTLKPFVYALALDQGLVHSHTLLKDTPTSFSEYTPDNYGNDFKGPMKTWEALVQSRNIPAVALARELKNPDLYDFLKDAQISNLKEKGNYGLSIVLGSAEISPIELSQLYCSLLNDGELKNLHFLMNDEQEETEENAKKLLTNESSFITRKMLEMNEPTERSRDALWMNVGFKTGTSIGFRDAWSAGFFGKYVLVVWVGNFDGTSNNFFLGRSAAAPLFFGIADEMIERGFVHNFLSKAEEKETLKLKEIEVCSVSGGLLNGDCPTSEKAYFIPGVSPIEKCKIHKKITENGKISVKEFWSTEFLELFELAGLPRNTPESLKVSGKPPEILSPLANTEYIMRGNRDTVILRASAESDAQSLFWFSGKEFLAKSKPNEKVEWKPSEFGTIEITVSDSKGRSSTRFIKVSSVD